MTGVTLCLWYDGTAEEAANFYAATFPDSSVGTVHRAPGDFPSGKQGDALTVDFTVLGIACIGLNGGPMFRFSPAISFFVKCTTQQEVVEAITAGRPTKVSGITMTAPAGGAS